MTDHHYYTIEVGKLMIYNRPGHEWDKKTVRVDHFSVFWERDGRWGMSAEVCCDGICSGSGEHFNYLIPIQESHPQR